MSGPTRCRLSPRLRQLDRQAAFDLCIRKSDDVHQAPARSLDTSVLNAPSHRAACRPRSRVLQLCSDPEDRSFIAESRKELHSNWQAILVPEKRHGRGGYACPVSEWTKRVESPAQWPHAGPIHVRRSYRADGNWRLSERRHQNKIPFRLECGEVPAGTMGRSYRPCVVESRIFVGGLVKSADSWLEIIRSGRPAERGSPGLDQ